MVKNDVYDIVIAGLAGALDTVKALRERPEGTRRDLSFGLLLKDLGKVATDSSVDVGLDMARDMGIGVRRDLGNGEVCFCGTCTAEERTKLREAETRPPESKGAN